MLSLLVDNGWLRNCSLAEPFDRITLRLVTYGAAIAIAGLFIVAGIFLAASVFDATPHPPPIVKERIRLM